MDSNLQNRSILIIEDEPDIAQLLKLNLSDICDEISIADNGHDGLAAAQSRDWGLIVLDIRLPGIDGLEICKRIRENINYTPILMLTAKSSELDRVLGLEIGADDYITKPFSILELTARVKAMFRRTAAMQQNPNEQATTIEIDGLVIDSEKHKVTHNGKDIELTAKEFDLLYYLAQNPGRVYTRLQLLDKVWGYGHDGYEHTVNSHINRLRAKVEADPSTPKYIVTVWGVGYRFGQ